MNTKQRGFTLIEILIVLIVLSLVVGAVTFAYSNYTTPEGRAAAFIKKPEAKHECP